VNASPLSHHWQQLPEAAIRRFQSERLRHYLRAVVLPFSAHYRGLFREHGLTADSIRTLDDLARLPFTTKADLLNTPEHPQRFQDFIIVPDPDVLSRRPGTMMRGLMHGRESVRRQFEAEFRPIFLTYTTGRAAESIPFLLTQHDLTRLSIAGRRMMEVCNARHEDRLINAFPFAPHLAFWLTHFAGTAFGVLMFNSGGGKVMNTDETVQLIRKFRPDGLIGIPTFLYHVLRQAVEENVHCENLRRIVLAGEKVSDGLRLKLHELARELKAPAVDIMATYGFTEARMAWAECPFPPGQTSSGYHLYPDLGIIEVINPQTGKVVPNGQPGELVFTPLDARGSVVLRYRTGDYLDGGLTYEPCPYCGRSLPRLRGNIARRSDIRELGLDKLKGTLVDFNELEHVLDDDPQIGAWQLELRKVNDDPHELDEIVLHAHITHKTDEAQLRRELSRRCFARTGVHPNRILFHNNEDMQQLQGVGRLIKEQKFVDHRPGASGPKPANPAACSAPGGETPPPVVVMENHAETPP
jgi:phenylacetate-CoA ligase